MGNAPLHLDWDDLLSSSKANEEPPPEVEVVAERSSDRSPSSAHLNDNQLHEKIQRIRSNLGSGFRDKLSDKGAKLESSLVQLQSEVDRRRILKAKDAGRSERPREYETSESSGKYFFKDFSHQADPSPNNGWISVRRNKCDGSRKNGKQQREDIKPTDLSRHGDIKLTKKAWHEDIKTTKFSLHENIKPAKLSTPTRMSSGSSPFLCASSLSDEDSDCSITEYSPAERCLYDGLSKRRKASENSHRLNPREIKVPDVVLLDKEDVEPKQPILEDVPEYLKEARIFYPSRDDPKSIELSYSDIKCLDPERYLTSPIMNYYIRYLQRPLPLACRPRGEFHFFNTYFFIKLHEAVSCKGDRNECFKKLRRWWKGVNIFQKAYIFMPVHGDMHWSLVIICIPSSEDESGPIVLHLDSLGMHCSNTILGVVDCYLKEEWNYVNKNDPPTYLPIAESIWSNLPSKIETKRLRVPQQKNEYDCGLFVLYFMERFINEVPERLKRKDLDMFGSKWFKPEEASGLRKRVRDLLIEEFENARFENGRELESPPASCCSSPENDVQLLIEV